MPQFVTISVPQPCHENWAAMTPAAQGRHCVACAKTVVDFSRMTDAEVVAYLSRASGPSCGRFRVGQLNRPLRLPLAASVSQRWAAATLALLGVGATVPAVAQMKSAAPQEQQILLGETTVSANASPECTIRGRVTGVSTGEGLPGVTVLVKGTTNGTSTNSDGSFALQVTLAPDVELTFSSIGYFTQQMSVTQFIDQHNSIVQLAMDEKAMSEAIITGGYCVSRWYTPRGLWQRLTWPFWW